MIDDQDEVFLGVISEHDRGHRTIDDMMGSFINAVILRELENEKKRRGFVVMSEKQMTALAEEIKKKYVHSRYRLERLT